MLSVVGILQLNGGLMLRTGLSSSGHWSHLLSLGAGRTAEPALARWHHAARNQKGFGLDLGGTSHCSSLVVRPLPLQNTPVLQARSGLLPCELWGSLTQAPQHLHDLSRLIHRRFLLDWIYDIVPLPSVLVELQFYRVHINSLAVLV
jgi:hypothetical protein